MSESTPLAPSTSPFPPSSRREWEEEAAAQLRGSSLEKLNRTLVDGTTIAPIYHYEDFAHNALRDGVPGEAPFHRGFSAAGWGAAGWGIASSLSAHSLEQLGALLKEEVEQGATALRLPLEVTETVGWLPSLTAEQLKGALEGISLPHITLLLDSGAASAGSLAVFLASLDDPSLEGPLDLHTLWDPLQTEISQRYASGGVSIDEQLSLLSEALSWFADRERRSDTVIPSSAAAHPRVLGIDTTFIAEAGGGPVHELVWLGAALIEYLRILEASGHAPHDVIRRTGAQLSASPQFFVTTALFRAARVIVGTILSEYRCDPAEEKLPLHALCLRRPLSRLDPHTNSLRVSAEVFGAALGGATTITALPFDGIDGDPSPRGRRLARNTQLILRDEAQLNHVLDPAGGSWYLESLTEQLAQQAWRRIQEIETRGGLRSAVREGYLQQMVAEAATKSHRDSISRRAVLVGVNQYPLPGETLSPIPTESIACSTPTGKEASSTRAAVTTTSSRPHFAHLVESARKGAPLSALAASCHTISTPTPPLITPRRDALPFETLRARVSSLSVRPRVTVCAIGDAAALRARIDFCRDLLGLAGVIVEVPAPVGTIGEALAVLAVQQPSAVVLCAPDASYPELVAPFLRELSAQRGESSPPVLLAGQPGEHEQTFRAAGIHSFMHLRADPIELLSGLIDTISPASKESREKTR